MERRAGKHRVPIRILAEHTQFCKGDIFQAYALGLCGILQEVLNNIVAKEMHCDLSDLPRQGFDEAPNLALRAMLHKTLDDPTAVLVHGSVQKNPRLAGRTTLKVGIDRSPCLWKLGPLQRAPLANHAATTQTGSSRSAPPLHGRIWTHQATCGSSAAMLGNLPAPHLSIRPATATRLRAHAACKPC